MTFVAQGPVLVLAALALRSMAIPGDLKLLILAPAAVVGSFALAAGDAVTRAIGVTPSHVLPV